MGESKVGKYPVHEDLDVDRGVTISKSNKWWKAALEIDGYSGREVAVYLWKMTDSGWKRKQKYKISSREDWDQDREVIDSLVTDLPEI